MPVESTRTRTVSRVFVARLVGTTVFDPLGDPVGKVHDVIVLIQTVSYTHLTLPTNREV